MNKQTELRIPVSQALRLVLVSGLEDALKLIDTKRKEITAALGLLMSDSGGTRVDDKPANIAKMAMAPPAHKISAKGRAAISRAQKARWQKQKQTSRLTTKGKAAILKGTKDYWMRVKSGMQTRKKVK